MNSSELIFYPIIRKSYTPIAKARKPMFIAFAVLALFLTIFLKVPWWAFFVLLVPGGIGCLILTWTVSDAKAWDCGGYEVVEINEFYKFLSLDGGKVNFDEIDYAEVVFDEAPNLIYFSQPATIGLINSKILIHMQNKEQKIIPVQYRAVLNQMVSVLKKHISIEYDKNNKILKNNPVLWRVVFHIFIFVWILIVFYIGYRH